LGLLLPVATAHAQTSPPPASLSLPPTLAVINGKPLFSQGFLEAMEQGFAREIFEELLHRRVVWDEAQRLGIVLSKQEFEQALKGVMAEYPTKEAFQASLRHQGMSEAFFLQRLKTEMLLDKIVEKRGSIPEEEIAAYYDKHRDQFVRPARVHLWDIVTTDLDSAYTARRRIAAGEEFAVVAKEMSVAPSAARGGEVGWVAAGEIPDRLMSDTAFSLEVGQTSNPLLVEGKYHVLYVTEAQPGVNRTLAQARSDIIIALREEKGLTREAVLDSLVRTAEVQINWDPLRYLNGEYLAMKQIKVVVDGKPVALPRPAYIAEGGRMLVPAKPVAEALGARLTWKAETSTLVVERAGRQAAFQVGNRMATVGEKSLRMEVAPRLEGGVLMVEPRPLVESLGGSLQWQPLRNTLAVKSAP
jgi:parvulin-like peptidyl-prolyl isomerase